MQEAFAKLEQLRRKGIVTDDSVELVSYREEKYTVTYKTAGNLL